MSAIVELIKAFIKSSNHTAESYKEFKTNLERLINTGQNVNEPDKYNRSALHHAAIYGDVKLVEMLLKHGAMLHEDITNAPFSPDVTAIIKIHASQQDNKIISQQDNNIISQQDNKIISPQENNIISPQENNIIAYFMLALLASLAIAAIGVLAVCGIMSCLWVICLAVAIVASVSCVSSLVFLHLLDKQNTQRQEITTESTEDKLVIGQTDKTSRHKFLVGACVVLHISAVVSAILCQPLCLVVIGILSIRLLGIKFSCRTPNEMPGIMQKVQGMSSSLTH